jgi:N-acetylglucosamine-6-phosphate deacetylase
MRPFHHREPGAVGAALDTDAFVELIVDGYHLHPAAVRLTVRAKGLDRICLVTDAVLGEGPEPARFPDGTLAGSRLTMNEAVRNFQAFTGLSLPEALRPATLNPARVLGLAHRKGSLTQGKDADLILFDQDWKIHGEIVGGEILWLSDPGRYR